MIKVNQVPYDEDSDTPLLNLQHKLKPTLLQKLLKGSFLSAYIVDKGHVSERFLRLRYEYYPTSKDMLKAVFGRQLLCRQYSYRNWIWTLSNEDDSVIMNLMYDQRGLYVGFNEDCDIKKVFDFYKEIVEYILNFDHKK